MGDLKVNVLMILQNMVNGAIDIINSFIGILNKIPGVNISLIEQVTFGTAAQLENEAAKQARESALNDYRAEIEAGIADRQAQLDIMMNDARTATTSRLAEIESVIAEQARKTAQDSRGANVAVDSWETIRQGLDDIAGNTGSMANSLDYAEEDLKYMRDVAERGAVNRYTTINYEVDMSGMNNNISKETDLDGVLGYLNNGLEEAVDIADEGAHY